MDTVGDLTFARVFGAFVNQTARISPDEKVMKVPLELEVEALKGGDEKSPIVIQNLPFGAAGFGDVRVGRSTVYRYTYEGRDWDYGGRRAAIRTFNLGGEI